MALNIRNPEANRLAAEVAQLAGETKIDAVIQALQERRERLQRQQDAGPHKQEALANRLDQIALRCAAWLKPSKIRQMLLACIVHCKSSISKVLGRK